ncbi:MAG: hypothetical protein KDK08_04355, partial [Rhizobiaceae bacterium]|nr:hypothetical protein [Rhizobiaceae bacterium]
TLEFTFGHRLFFPDTKSHFSFECGALTDCGSKTQDPTDTTHCTGPPLAGRSSALAPSEVVHIW